jgi:hypothetical protein
MRPSTENTSKPVEVPEAADLLDMVKPFIAAVKRRARVGGRAGVARSSWDGTLTDA